MIECSPDPHFTQTQNTNQESLLTANAQNYQKVFRFCFVFGVFFSSGFFFFLRNFLGLQLKLQFF